MKDQVNTAQKGGMGFIGRGLVRTSITQGKRLSLPCLALLAVLPLHAGH